MAPREIPSSRSRSSARELRTATWRAGAVVLAAVAVCALLELRVQWMNGMLWTRPWREQALATVVLVFVAGSLPLWWGVWREYGSGRAGRWTVAGLTAGCLCLMLAASFWHSGAFSPERLPRAIEHEHVTSYYTDALALRSEPAFLARYPDLMDSLHLHSANKPPGPVLFFMGFVELFGPGATSAHVSGLFLALLAALVVPTCFVMVRTLTESREAAFAAAALTALCPGLVLGLPAMDQLTPLFTCLLVTTWAIALRRHSMPAASAFGAVLGMALLFTPLVLVLGLFLAGLTVLHLAPSATRRERWKPTLGLVAAALGTLAALYTVFSLATGYDVVAVFREILGSKHDWDPELTRQELLGRTYWKTLISDPWEFALATGWLVVLLVLMRLAWGGIRARSGTWKVELLALAQLVIMPQLGFVRGESARLWLFLVPFLVLPAGVELAQWTPKHRAVAIASLMLVLTAIYRNMLFLKS